jgi:heterodisulfide reductase subunit D
VKILNKAGIKVAYLYNDEWCCGVPQIADGSIVIAERMLKHNVELLKARGAKRVITSCAGCFHALKTEYKEILGHLPFEAFHISEVISKLLEEGKITLTQNAKRIVTYHDPCHLGRYEGIYDPPRMIIKKISGEKFVEMLRNRERAWCCGGGTTEYVAFPELSAKIATKRVEEAKKAGAEIIITACPLCVSVLKPAAYKVNIEVYDLPVFIAKEMGIEIS